MRKLITRDVFALARLVRASGARQELQKIVKDLGNKTEDEINVESVGIDGMLAILECCGERKAEAAFYEMIEDIAEVKGVSELPVEDFFEILSLINRDNDLPGFFKRVSGILKRN